MKLNFWQWVGVFLIVLALVVYFLWDKPRRERKKDGESQVSVPVPVLRLTV
jgi:heme/copper-type cytochrome/quinol oxidase subunit 2